VRRGEGYSDAIAHEGTMNGLIASNWRTVYFR